MTWPKHVELVREVHALTYEAEQLQATNTLRAQMMGAIAVGMRANFHWDVEDDVVQAKSTQEHLQLLRGYVAEMGAERRKLAVDQAQATRPYTLFQHDAFVKLVDGTSADTYLTLALQGGSQTSIRRYPGWCSPTSLLLQRDLRKEGAETKHMWRSSAANNHHFLRAAMPDGEQLDIDPTWQQYLPESTDYSRCPNVLIARTGNMATALAMHGVPQKDHHWWLEARESHHDTDPSYYDRDLRAIFEADPWLPPLPLDQQQLTATSVG